jgi:hypothetical protein
MIILAIKIAAQAASAAANDTTAFRIVTDGGILAVLGTTARGVYVAGQVRQMVIDHSARIARIEAARDAEAMAMFNGYRPRNHSDS